MEVYKIVIYEVTFLFLFASIGFFFQIYLKEKNHGFR